MSDYPFCAHCNARIYYYVHGPHGRWIHYATDLAVCGDLYPYGYAEPQAS